MKTPLRLRWSGWTHRGRIRQRNEDAFLAVIWDAQEMRYLGKIGEAELCFAEPDGENFLFAVSDGMGGENGGAFASRLVVQSVAEWLPRQATQDSPQETLVKLYASIHRKLNYHGACYEECRGMGATLSLIWFTGGQAVFGHVGDSRLYALPAQQELKQISEDDTQVGWLYRQGQLNEREARFHPAKNRLSKVLGNNLQQVIPQTGTLPLKPGDRYLLCSDGVVDGLWNHALERGLASTQVAAESGSLAETLVKAAVAESGRDNVTAITLEVTDA